MISALGRLKEGDFELKARIGNGKTLPQGLKNKKQKQNNEKQKPARKGRRKEGAMDEGK